MCLKESIVNISRTKQMIDVSRKKIANFVTGAEK